jgi:hypothetical protein
MIDRRGLVLVSLLLAAIVIGARSGECQLNAEDSMPAAHRWMSSWPLMRRCPYADHGLAQFTDALALSQR